MKGCCANLTTRHLSDINPMRAFVNFEKLQHSPSDLQPFLNSLALRQSLSMYVAVTASHNRQLTLTVVFMLTSTPSEAPLTVILRCCLSLASRQCPEREKILRMRERLWDARKMGIFPVVPMLIAADVVNKA